VAVVEVIEPAANPVDTAHAAAVVVKEAAVE
jgi:hypothetical protein